MVQQYLDLNLEQNSPTCFTGVMKMNLYASYCSLTWWKVQQSCILVIVSTSNWDIRFDPTLIFHWTKLHKRFKFLKNWRRRRRRCRKNRCIRLVLPADVLARFLILDAENKCSVHRSAVRGRPAPRPVSKTSPRWDSFSRNFHRRRQIETCFCHFKPKVWPVN